MNSSVVWLATILGLGILSLLISSGEICASLWTEHKRKAMLRRDEPRALPVIGFLSSRSSVDSPHLLQAFQRGLAERGYVEGKNLKIEYRWAEGQYDRLPAMAVDLARKPVAVLVSAGGQPAAVVAAAATKTLPIVANFSADPVASGLATSLDRPSGNITGIVSSSATLEHERLRLFHELLPQAATIRVLLNANNPHVASQSKEMREAAHALGLELQILRAGTDEEIDTAFESIARHDIRALAVASDSFFDTRRAKLITLAARHAVPAMYSFREFPAAGGLISYGIDLSDVYRQLGVYAGRLVKGTKLSALSVLQPEKFELVINLKTAGALGLEVPPTLIARADQVIA